MAKYIPETADLNDVVMNGDELMDATTSVVRTFSTDFDTACVFAGDGAFTDGDKVVLPAVQGDAEVTARQAHVMGGYANHETLHKLLTDFKAFRRWAKGKGKLTLSMNNAIEDIRIENGGKELYNGIAKQIDKTAREVNRAFIDEVYPQQPDIVNDFGKIGPVAVTWAGRKLLGYQDESNEEALSLLPDDIRKRVERIAQQAMKLDHGVRGMGDVDQRAAYNGCKKAMQLAKRIVNQYMKELEEGREPDEDGDTQIPININPDSDGNNGYGEDGDTREGEQGSGDAEGEGNGENEGDTGGNAGSGRDEGDSESEGSNAGDNGQEGEPEGEEASGDGGRGRGLGGEDDEESNSHGASPGQVDLNREPLEEPEPIDPDLRSAVEKVVNEVNKDPSGYRVKYPQADKLFDRELRGTDMSHNRETYQRVKSEAGGSLSTIRRKLERVLLEIKQSLWENGARSGRLDVRRNAAKVVQFNPNIYRRRVDETNVNSALMILVDQSGSMCGRKNRVSAQATIALCEALEPTGVPIEVIGHYTVMPSQANGTEAMDDNEWYREPYGRIESIAFFLYKSFDEALSQARAALGYMCSNTGGANADGDAIRFAARRLLQREEPRKVMFVLSDGEPAWYCNTHDENQWTRDCVQWCIDRGIQLIGIGIQDENVKFFYPDYIIVHDLDEFATNYMNKIAQILLGQGEKNNSAIATEVRRASKF